MLRLFLLVCVLVLAPSAHAQRRDTDIMQSLIQPTVRGIAYDSNADRVFASLCPSPQFGGRRFTCDLVLIGLSEGGTLHYIRSGGVHGYTEPVVSADGRYLFAARTPRGRRTGQRQLDQELVRIDLASDEEIVVQPASQYRYERLISLGRSGILAVQAYRSSDDLECRGDYCTDSSRVVLINDAGAYLLPGVESTTNDVVTSARISVIPLGADSAWISGVSTDLQGSRRMRSWLFDASTLQLSEPTSNSSELRPLFEQFATIHPDAVRWRWEQISPGRPPELRAFPRSTDTYGGIEQASLSADGYGVRLTKRREGRSIQLDIELARNQGVSPWETVRRVSIRYTPPPRSRER